MEQRKAELTNLPKDSQIVKDDKEVKVTQESIDCVVMQKE